MNDKLATASTILLTACALLITGLVVRRALLEPVAAEPAAPREVEAWERLTQAGHVLGPADAEVKIVEFADFQCPFCKRVESSLDSIRRKYPRRVAVIFRHFPLRSLHPYAFEAAIASECAAAQGMFEAYHDALFAHQDSIGTIPFDVFAKRVGIPNMKAFRSCMEGERFRERVQQDFDAAWNAGLRATPSVIVNGTLLPGTPSFEELDRWVQKYLESESG